MSRNFRGLSKAETEISRGKEIEDFWDDCLPLIKSKNNNVRNKTQCNLQTNILFNKLVNKHPELRENIETRNLTRIRSQKAIENCCKMYDRWKQSRAISQEKKEKLRNTLISKEMQNCTWIPKINRKKKFRSIYDNPKKKIRLTKNQSQVPEPIEDENSESKENKYKPNINSSADLSAVFDNGVTVYDNAANNTFFYRLEKARIDNKTKFEDTKIRRNKQNSNSLSRYNHLKKLNVEELKKVFHKELFEINLEISSEVL